MAAASVRTSVLWVAMAVYLVVLGGCSSYALRGVVLEGEAPMVIVVDDDDERLQESGIVQASIESKLDPRSLGSTTLTPTVTDNKGRFAIPIEEFGAGTLEYEVMLFARRRGFSPTEQIIPVPSSGKRVIIYLTKGVDRGRKPTYLDETMEMTRPYR